MADSTIPQNGVTNQTTPPAQDLQINLEEAPKVEENTLSENKESELNLDLDLNLPESPKNDDRLKEEDKKNSEKVIEQPVPEVVETPVVNDPKLEEVFAATPEKTEQVEETVPEQTVIEPIQEEHNTLTPEPEQSPVEEQPTVQQESTNETPVVEEIPETTEKDSATETKSETPMINEPVVEETPVTEPAEGTKPEPIPNAKPTAEENKEQISTTITEDPMSSEVPADYHQDMKIIEELNMNENKGGLAEEAKIETHPAAAEETPKTFDLDAMLGTTPTPVTIPTSTEQLPNDEKNEQKSISDEILVDTKPVEQITEIPVQAEPMTAPAFTIPTPTSEVPVQTIMQTNIPHNKNKWVKTLLFTVMFVALGFTTFFILKTMYPIEFNNIFGGNDTQMHASEEVTIETWMIDELSGNIDTMTGEDMSGTTEEEINNFWELNDLWTMTEENTEQTDVMRLTDYASKGNELLEQGKAINNNTVIKYGLYISKKATDFLGKIANGEEISNLSWYFAQFDQYITQLEEILSPTTTETNVEEVSPTSSTNAFEEMTTDTPNITE